MFRKKLASTSAILMGAALLFSLIGLQPVQAAPSKGPQCKTYQPCLGKCNRRCLDKCRAVLKQCKLRNRDGHKRCIAQIPNEIRKCMGQSTVVCSRRCKNTKSRTCRTACVRKVGKRCNKAFFANRCKIAYHKAKNKCMPTYRRCAKPCCAKGFRACVQRRVCKRVKCVKKPCPPVCRCVGRRVCSKICRPGKYKVRR